MEKIMRLKIWSWHPPVLEKRRKNREDVYGGRRRERKRRDIGRKEGDTKGWEERAGGRGGEEEAEEVQEVRKRRRDWKGERRGTRD